MSYSSHIAFTYLAPIAGVLLALAFAPFNFYGLALVAVVFMLYAWDEVTPKVAAWRGFLFGVGLFGLGVSWVFVSVYYFGGSNLIGAVLLTVFCALFWALFPALTGYLVAVLSAKKYRCLNILLVPLLWVLMEYARGYWFLNGFPWFQLAYAQIDTPLAGFVPLTGVYGTGLVFLVSAALMVHALKVSGQRVVFLSVAGLLWLSGYIFSQQQWTHALAAPPLKVALVQGNISQDQKWASNNRLNTLLKYKRLTQVNWDAHVIVWPETAIPAFLAQVDDFFLTPLEEEARAHQVDLIVSLPMQGEAEDELYNGVMTLGRERGVYKKNHLLPFGEYMPLQPLSGWVMQLLGVHLGNFTAGGAQQGFLKAGGYPFSTSICYEDVFGDEVLAGIADAAYLVNVTNDAWFGNSIEPHQHMQIARMRALETGRYLLRATNTGITAIVAPNGKILQQAPQFETAVLRGEIQPMAGVTPYAMIGDAPIISVCVALLIGLLLFERYRGQRENQ